eukprot:g9307.t1
MFRTRRELGIGDSDPTDLMADHGRLVASGATIFLPNPWGQYLLLINVAQHLNPALLVRIGHPVRVDENLHKLTLDGRVAQTDAAKLCRDVEREIKEHLTALAHHDSSGSCGGNKVKNKDFATRRHRREEVSKLRKELKKRSLEAVKSVLAAAQVVFCTCAGASEVKKRFLSPSATSSNGGGGESNQTEAFDVVLVDEAAQTLEVACWIPLLCGKKAVLAGDHNQLAATVKSESASKQGLDVTLFGRMIDRFGSEISSLLSIQYRMHEVIMGWSSGEFYDGKLVAADEVRKRTLFSTTTAEKEQTADVLGGGEDPATTNTSGNWDSSFPDQFPLVFVDTAGNPACREQEPEGAAGNSNSIKPASNAKASSILHARTGSTRCNPGEAKLLCGYIRWLRSLILLKNQASNSMNSEKTSICVITPYNQQVDHLRLLFAEQGDNSVAPEDAYPSQLRFKNIPVNTVDSYQGREADIILLSLVRSNELAEVGFLADFRRLNVAVTRAKKHCCVFGNSETVCSDEVLASLYGYAMERGKVVFAGEEVMERLEGLVTTSSVAADSCLSTTASAGPFDAERSGATSTAFDRKDHKNFGGAQSGASKKKKEPALVNATGAPAPQQKQQPQPMHMSDEEIEKRRAKYLATIEKFLGSGAAGGPWHDFPKSLNARERLVVHEVCEKLALKSESQGDGKKRFVRVFRNESATEKVVKAATVDVADVSVEVLHGAAADTTDGSETRRTAEEIKMTPDYQPKEASSSSGSKLHDVDPSQITDSDGHGGGHQRSNQLLTELARERESRQQKRLQEAEAARGLEKHKKLEAKKAKKKAAGDRIAAGGGKNDEVDDFDAALNDFGDNFPRGKCTVCKVSVTHLTEAFTTCEYCRRTFCFQHLQAELHGCGEAARAKERANRKNTLDPNRSQKLVSDAQHRKAQTALSAKLQEAASDRSKKNAGGKK